MRHATLCGLLVLALAAPAEGAWVLWEESGDLEAFHRAADPRPRSSYSNLEDCIKAIDVAWPKGWSTTKGSERQGFSRLTPTSAIVVVRDRSTNVDYIFTYTCLPDTMAMRDPRTGETAQCGPPPSRQRECVMDFGRRGWAVVPY